jgi:flagellar basal-body rod protein FlgB
MNLFHTLDLVVLERSLDAAQLRQKVLANNIANIDTPNFKRSDVSFDALLQSYLGDPVQPLSGRRTNPRHLPIGVGDLDQLQPAVVQETDTTVQANGNNVDIDSEMTQLAQNQIKYNALITQLNHQFSLLSTAINEGRR